MRKNLIDRLTEGKIKKSNQNHDSVGVGYLGMMKEEYKILSGLNESLTTYIDTLEIKEWLRDWWLHSDPTYPDTEDFRA